MKIAPNNIILAKKLSEPFNGIKYFSWEETLGLNDIQNKLFFLFQLLVQSAVPI